MRDDRNGHTYPDYVLRPSRALAESYLASQGARIDLDEVPPTYMIFLRGEALGVNLFEDLDIPRRRALHGGQRYEWFHPIGWDDEVRVTATVLKTVEKPAKNGSLWFADVEYAYRIVGTGVLALKELTRIIERRPA